MTKVGDSGLTPSSISGMDNAQVKGLPSPSFKPVQLRVANHPALLSVAKICS